MKARIAAMMAVGLAACGVGPGLAAGPLALGGAVDLNGSGLQSLPGLNAVYQGETSFDAYHLRLAAGAAPLGGLQVSLEARMSDATQPRVTAAYLSYTPWADNDLHLLAGKMPWVIGTWGARGTPERQPLVGVPLMYQFPTRLPANAIVPDPDSLYRMETGASSAAYGSSAAADGMRIVEDAWWDVGVGVTGSARPFEYAFGVTSGTPSAPSPTRDSNGAKSVLGRVGITPFTGVRVGASGAYGAYLSASVGPELPPGRRPEDYHQELLMADAELLAGHAELRAEWFANRWETPTLGDLAAKGGYAEAKLTLAPGVYAAGRYDLLRFSDLLESTGESFPWSDNVDRLEAGLGYRPARGVVLKTVWQRTTLDDGDARETHDLVAVQAAFAF